MAVLVLARAFLRRPGLGVASAATVLATLATLIGVDALVAVPAATDGFRAEPSDDRIRRASPWLQPWGERRVLNNSGLITKTKVDRAETGL